MDSESINQDIIKARTAARITAIPNHQQCFRFPICDDFVGFFFAINIKFLQGFIAAASQIQVSEISLSGQTHSFN